MELMASVREKFGKSLGSLRKEGFVPAVFYGHGMENKSLSIARRELEKAVRDAGTSTVITLLVGGEKHAAIIHEVQHDPVRDEIVHVDFYGVRMDEKITVTIPIELVGEAPAIKEHGGVLNRALMEIEVEALPGKLPHEFTVDVSGLKEIDDAIYVKDLKVSSDVKVLIDPDSVVVSVTPPVKEEEIAPAPVADVSEVKVETEEKKAEREAAKTVEENA